jgi:hypothetical protein
MAFFQAKNKKQSWYGESIGILILDATYPCIPGNVGNASTFPFPVRYKVVKEASIERLLKQKDITLLEPFIDAAIELQEEGVKAITISVGVNKEIPLLIGGMEDQKEFREAILEEKGTLDSDLIESEVVGVAKKLTSQYLILPQ